MGGSGGGYFSEGAKPKELQQQVRQTEATTRDEKFEADVAAEINNLLSAVTQRDTGAVQSHLKEITDALDKDIEGSVGTLFGGSVAKHTYVDGLSDVDALVILNKTDLKDANPSDVLDHFANRLRERFPKTTITPGRMTVTIAFGDVELQLLPALKSGQGIRIPKGDGKDWSPIIRPDQFATKLTEINRKCGGKVIPTIKLAKAILSQLPKSQQMTGYHVESLAVEVFRNYSGDQTTKALLKHFFQSVPDLVKEPIKDSTKQSLHVDDYLGAKGSIERRIIADALGRISRGIQNADGAKSVDQWKKILGE